MDQLGDAMNRPLLGVVLSWVLAPFILAWAFIRAIPYLAALLAFFGGLAVFWLTPTVVWLWGFHGVSFTHAIDYAATLSGGRAGYDRPWGNSDPSVLVFGIFNVLAWLPIVGVVYGLGQLAEWWQFRRDAHELRSRRSTT